MFSAYDLFLSAVNLILAMICVYYGRKLHESTRGAKEFWLFLAAFIGCLGTYTLFDFARITIFTWFDSPIRSAQDLAITFASIFALISGVYAKKIFDELRGAYS
ncbi:MAG TPA: hypothetical protein VIO11_09700 [Candidatus Methanoperedens sp.]